MAGNVRKNADVRIIEALAVGASREGAAKHAGVSVRTVHRRLKDPEFQRSVTEERSRFLDRTFGTLSVSAVDAATTLRNLLKADSEQVRLGAARGIITLTVQIRDQLDLAERIAVLEARLTTETEPQKWHTRRA